MPGFAQVFSFWAKKTEDTGADTRAPRSPPLPPDAPTMPPEAACRSKLHPCSPCRPRRRIRGLPLPPPAAPLPLEAAPPAAPCCTWGHEGAGGGPKSSAGSAVGPRGEGVLDPSRKTLRKCEVKFGPPRAPRCPLRGPRETRCATPRNPRSPQRAQGNRKSQRLPASPEPR